jgi:competence protein ComEC
MTREALDLRLAPAALAAWAMAAWGVGWSVDRAVVGACLLLLAGAACVVRDRRAPREPAGSRFGFSLTLASALVVAGGALGIAGLRAGAVHAGPIPALAIARAEVHVAGRIASDPVRTDGTFAPYAVVRLDATSVSGRGVTVRGRSPLLAIGDLSWMRLHLGERVEVSGRLSPAGGPDLTAVLIGRPDPLVVARAAWVYRAVSRVRSGLTEAASPLPPAQAALVPALVDGDDASMPTDVVADFKTTGLTHLLAVSGSNLTLVLGFVLLTARWCRVRAQGLAVVGVLAVVFFVLLARPQPSVLRAAAMGLVALAGLSVGGRRRGARALCVSVTVLVLIDPWLARSVGFLLSTLATAGILLLAPGWRDAMARWMPVPLAEAVAVPLSAQIVCTPVIAAISSQVSVVGVAANLLAAPAVGPATVAGLVAGLVAMPSHVLGHLLGRLAGVPAWWIVTVARRCAHLRGASIGWPVGPVAVAALTLLCLALVVSMGRLLRHRYACLAVAALMVVTVAHPPGRFGWPPGGWLLVVCDVGQGDGLVLNAGHGVAVVVDTGPDPLLMDACLDRLQVTTVALVVLTHFHADHVDGLSGVLHGRSVAEIEVSPLSEPVDRAASVRRLAARAGVPVTVAVPGERRTIGQLSWQVLGPRHMDPGLSGAPSATDEGSGPNNASIVMRLDADGHEFLLAGDAEREEQHDLVAAGDDLAVDVLKVAHHGSANQDPAFLAATHALVGVISVGADNDYGHPSPATLALLHQLGVQTYRTDLNGDIAVAVRAGQLAVVTSKR